MSNPAPLAGEAAPEPSLHAAIQSMLDEYEPIDVMVDASAPIEAQEEAARVAANRFLQILSDVEGEIEAAKREKAGYIAHLETIHARRMETLNTRRGYLISELRGLFRFLPRRGKTKSVKLLNGRLGERERGARFSVEDDKQALPVLAGLIAAGTLPETLIVEKPQIVAKEMNDALLKELAKRRVRTEIEHGEQGAIDQQVVTLVDADGAETVLAGITFKQAADDFYATPETSEA